MRLGRAAPGELAGALTPERPQLVPPLDGLPEAEGDRVRVAGIDSTATPSANSLNGGPAGATTAVPLAITSSTGSPKPS